MNTKNKINDVELLSYFHPSYFAHNMRDNAYNNDACMYTFIAYTLAINKNIIFSLKKKTCLAFRENKT